MAKKEKLKPCPFCGSRARRNIDFPDLARCSQNDCYLSRRWFPVEKWNKPASSEDVIILEKQFRDSLIAERQRYNDLVAKISIITDERIQALRDDDWIGMAHDIQEILDFARDNNQ